jgi:putative ABC transport system permease protein
VDLYFHRAGGGGEISVDGAVVLVDHEKNVESVLAELRKLGLQCYSSLEQLRQFRLMYLLIFSGMTCVALVSLVVAGLGIANTMLISVLQRTREIGIMKAVGADSRHLQFIFLVEGALIGCVGGVLGLLLAWAASFPADAWIQSMASRDLKVELRESICAFPPWLPLAVFSFAVAITIIAALYPSRRAAGIDPVAALRYE